MKNLKYILAVYLFISVVLPVQAEENAQQVIYVRNSKVTAPLLAKWIEEYQAVNPDVVIRQVEGKNDKADIDLTVSEPEQVTLTAGEQVAYVGRLAFLPVTSSENPHSDELNKKKLSKKELKNLFFQDEFLFDENKDNKKNKLASLVTVYTGNNSYSGTNALASHFGHEVADARGKKISGDDIFLLNALKKDQTGIAFNNLSYLYDIETRQLKTDLALLPLDIKKEQLEALNSGNIDQTIELLEKQKIDLIPVQKIGLVYSKEKQYPVQQFISWIINEGQQYNHTYGFLELDKETLAWQKKQNGSVLYSATKTN